MTASFIIEAVDLADGSRTELASFNNSANARSWLKSYVSNQSAGNWDLIEIYDTRGDDVERIAFWESDNYANA